MNDSVELKNQIQQMIAKADRSLSVAKRNFEEGHYDFASSRAYYAAFYTLEAVLLIENLTFSKHSAAISAFNQRFVKTNIFPSEFSKLISRLFRDRQIGDYDYNTNITEDDAKMDIDASNTILEKIKAYLLQKHLLSSQ